MDTQTSLAQIGAPVALYAAQPGKAFSIIGHTHTGSTGRYALTVTQPGTTTYKAVVSGRNGNVTTASARVVEKPTLTAKLAASTITARTHTNVTGHLAPARSGQLLDIYRCTGTSVTTCRYASNTRTNLAGNYSAGVAGPRTHHATLWVRVRALATSLHAQAWSAPTALHSR
jgi:hypothetical protein